MLKKTLLAMIAFTQCASAVSEPVSHDTASDGETRTDPAKVIVFGATRGVGLEIVRLLTSRGDAVSVFVRPSSDLRKLEDLNVRTFVGDALNETDVQNALLAEPFSGIISTLGCRKCDAPPDYIGNRNIIDTAKSTGVHHLMIVSTIGVGDSSGALPFFVRMFLRDRIKLKSKAEEYLRASDLSYTIIRPGRLQDGDPTGKAILTTDPDATGSIKRIDLAQLMVDVLYDPDTFGKTYSAIESR